MLKFYALFFFLLLVNVYILKTKTLMTDKLNPINFWNKHRYSDAEKYVKAFKNYFVLY